MTMFNLKTGEDVSALSEVVNILKTAVMKWNAWKAHIRLDNVNIGADIDGISLDQFKGLYKTMKDLGKLAEGLFDDIAEENQLLEMKLMPAVRKRGINSLPDEILQMILVETVRLVRYEEKPWTRELQLTCKRFNDIVNSSVHFWTWVTNRDRMRKKEASQLNTLKTLPIELYVVRYPEIKGSFLKTLLRNQDRIASIAWERDYHHTDFFSKHVKGCIDFPALKSLQVTNFLDFPNWSSPNLTHLYSDLIPPPGLFPLLRHWSFRQGLGLGQCGNFGTTSQEGLCGNKTLDFLGSTPLLKSLRFGLYGNDPGDVSGASCVTLPGVESLTIDCQFLLEDASEFMQKLKLPQVKRVVFIDDVCDGFYALFGRNISLQTVKSLEYQNKNASRTNTRRIRDNWNFLKSYDEIHRVFPNLERLDIRTEGYLYWYNSNATYWPNLHTVSFWHDSDYWKKNIAGLMANKNFASRLKHLKIYGTRREDNRYRDHRVDVSIRKILASVYDEDVLEVQPGIMAKKPDYDSLLRFRSEVGANCIAHQ